MPYRMPLYPLPVVIAILIWIFVFYSTGLKFMLSGLIVIATGAIAYFILAKQKRWWPYATNNEELITNNNSKDLLTEIE